MYKSLFAILMIFSAGLNFAVPGQTAVKSDLVLGEIVAMNGRDRFSLQTKDAAVEVMLNSATVFKKVPPGNPKLAAAVDAQFSEMGAGDKVVVTGTLAEGGRSIAAKTVYLMTKADIAGKTNAERAAWKTRGMTGRIVSLDAAAQEFTVAPRSSAAGQNIVVTPKEKIVYRRYAPDSVAFDDAKTSSFAELKVGDQVRLLGDKGADGRTFQAEQVVSGSFKMIAGPVLAVDAAKNEVTIRDVQTNQPATIVVKGNSLLKRFPAELATAMAMQMNGGQSGPVAVTMHGQQMSVSAAPPANSPVKAQPVRAADFDELLERFPGFAVSDLKVGEVIAASGTVGNEPNRVTAIKLVSGVEPFLRAAQTKNGAQPQRVQGGGFAIPGLDGAMGTP